MRETLNEILRIFIAKRIEARTKFNDLSAQVKSHRHGFFCVFGCRCKKLETEMAKLRASQEIYLAAEWELVERGKNGYEKTIKLLDEIIKEHDKENCSEYKILGRPLTTIEVMGIAKPVFEQLKEVRNYLLNLQKGAV